MKTDKPVRYSALNPRPWWHYALGITAVAVVGVGVYAAVGRYAKASTPTEPSAPEQPSTPSGSGGSGSGTSAPPNISGDSQGYNTKMFPDPGAVRLYLITMGYPVAKNGEPLPPGDLVVKKFQRDYNKVSKAVKSGKIKRTSADDPSLFKAISGTLADDGVAGKNTLRALEIAVANNLKNKIMWQTLVSEA